MVLFLPKRMKKLLNETKHLSKGNWPGEKTKEGKRKGNRAKKTKVNEKEHYMQLEQPTRTTIIMEVWTSSIRKGNYWGHAEVTTDRVSEQSHLIFQASFFL
jgi:hypothetical protein